MIDTHKNMIRYTQTNICKKKNDFLTKKKSYYQRTKKCSHFSYSINHWTCQWFFKFLSVSGLWLTQRLYVRLLIVTPRFNNFQCLSENKCLFYGKLLMMIKMSNYLNSMISPTFTIVIPSWSPKSIALFQYKFNIIQFQYRGAEHVNNIPICASVFRVFLF